MSMIAQIDPAGARRTVDGHDGPLSANARAKQEEAHRPAAAFGAAVTHRDARPHAHVEPSSNTDRLREREAVRRRDDERGEERQRRSRQDDRGRHVDIKV